MLQLASEPNASGGRAQRVCTVRPFPGQVEVFSAEVAVCRRRRVQRTAEIEVVNDGRRPEVEVATDQLQQFVLGQLARPKCLDGDRSGPGATDRVRDLDLAAVRKSGRDKVLRDVAGRIRRGAVDLRGVLAAEGAATVARNATIGVYDDLAPGESGVRGGAAQLETSAGVDQHLGAGVDQIARQDRVYDQGSDRILDDAVGNTPPVVTRDHDGLDPPRFAVLVLDRHL